MIASGYLESSEDSSFDDFAIAKVLASVDKWDDGKGSNIFVKAAKIQVKYIEAVFKMIQSGHPFWKAFGNDMKGAMKLAALLKKRHQDRVANATIDEHFDNLSGDLTTLKSNYNTHVSSGVSFI